MQQSLKTLNASEFISGVIEGFYGVPWVIDQRRRLFARLKDFGMNTYLYAPKDDSKHRAYWRELYSVEEGEALRVLIESAHENNLNFIYAISPGLDVTYSGDKDQQILKRKLDQVKEFGCKYFAILFDDIDSKMQQADRAKFKSFAEAQSYLTNELYMHLSEPEIFFFCPTEYCDAFAKPDVENSEYLRTIGENLLPNIRIMWTGPGIISEYITIKHIKRMHQLLRRKPLIWDNLHANDYDLNCIYLGPFTSRAPNLRKYLSGLLTNPNCEFECNYVPIYTLALWSHAETTDTDEDEFDQSSTNRLSKQAYHQSNVDIDMPSKFEYDDEGSAVRIDDCLLEHIDQYLSNRPNIEPVDLNKFSYEPDRLISVAIRKWLPIFNEKHVQITVYKLPIAAGDETIVAPIVEQPQQQQQQAVLTTTDEISELNTTTKEKAKLDACNSLVVNHHLYHHHQVDPTNAVTAVVTQDDEQQQQQQGEVVFNNNSNNDDIVVLPNLHAAITSSLSASSKKNNKKKLKKFLLSKRDVRKRERVDGGEFFKLRSCIKKKPVKKRFSFYKRKRKISSSSLLLQLLPRAATLSGGDEIADISNDSSRSGTIINDVDDDDDDRMDEQKMVGCGEVEEMESMTRPSSTIFLSPIQTAAAAQQQQQQTNMLVDEQTNIEATTAINGIVTATSANDIELLSMPPMSLPPSTRASSIASFKTSSSSSSLKHKKPQSCNSSGGSSSNDRHDHHHRVNRNNVNNSPSKKRKKYEPLISLSSSKYLFKVARKKLKKSSSLSVNTNYKQYNHLCTSPMDLGMLSDTTTTAATTATNHATIATSNGFDQLNECDLKIVLDLYYLPFQYGKFAVYLLKEFKWLKINAIRLTLGPNQNKVNEWMKRCERYLNVIDRIDLIQTKLTRVLNRQLFIEIDTRFNELNNFLQIIRLFICWLQQNCFILNEINKQEFCLNLNQYYRSEHCDRLEPWDFRGGIVDEMKRVTYFKSFNDLFHIGMPIQTRINTERFKLRNYRTSDYEQTKALFLRNSNTSELSYDLLAVDLFLEYSREYCFLIENESNQQICGILLAALNAKKLNEIYKMSCLSALCEKYPIGGENQNLIMNFHNSVSPFKLIGGNDDTLLSDYSSIFILKLNPSAINNELDMTYLVRQLLAALLLCLKSQGSTGLHTQFNFNNKDEDACIETILKKFYFKKLISSDDEISVDQAISNNYRVLGRRIRCRVK